MKAYQPHKINKSMASLAWSQKLVDKLHPPKQQEREQPQQMAQPQPQMTQQAPQTAPQQPPVDSLEAEANSVKELDSTLATGFEAVSKLADAMKEVTGVKKSITKRIKDRLLKENEKPQTEIPTT